MRKTCVTIVLLAVCSLLLHCSHKADVVTSSPVVVRTPAQLNPTEKDMVESVNRFSFKLIQAVNSEADPNKNVFVSPLSVSYALGMLRNGAGGATKTEIDSVLELSGFPANGANLAYQSLTTILTGADAAVTFSVANSFWSQRGFEVQSGFVEVCRKYFDARIEEVDFADPQTATDINNWVRDNTGGLIEKMVEPPIPADVIAMLLNALYFKGGWTYPFDSADTKPGLFRTSAGSNVTCDFMFKFMASDSLATGEKFAHSPAAGFADSQVIGITLPYGDHGFRMTLVLPRESISVDQLIGGLTQETWDGWMQSSRVSKPWFKMPKFEFEFGMKLNDILKSLGMNAAFDPNSADFSNLFVNTGSCISDVRHKAFVKVDEKGTEAAAVTIVTSVLTSFGPTIFDRPFFFVIHEVESGAVLFMGKVVDPTLKG
ncbi:MAG: serpin family protein [candidate division Zixibacteria bacterium]|nr:serpin family protein [candidate division Zixibacteria bacterium]